MLVSVKEVCKEVRSCGITLGVNVAAEGPASVQIARPGRGGVAEGRPGIIFIEFRTFIDCLNLVIDSKVVGLFVSNFKVMPIQVFQGTSMRSQARMQFFESRLPGCNGARACLAYPKTYHTVLSQSMLYTYRCCKPVQELL